jgi:hypothetical protein
MQKISSFTPTLRAVTVLAVSLSVLVSYNFMSAAWTNAPANPPANNTEVPINASAVAQEKPGTINLTGTTGMLIASSTIMTDGNVVGDILAATNQTWSDWYCDATGGNCIKTSVLASTTPVTRCEICLQCKPGGGAASGGTAVCADVNGGWSQDTGDLTSNGSPADDNDSCRIRMNCPKAQIVQFMTRAEIEAKVRLLNPAIASFDHVYTNSKDAFCNDVLAGSVVDSYLASSFSSPSNNTVATKETGTWLSKTASGRNTWLTQITCIK